MVNNADDIGTECERWVTLGEDKLNIPHQQLLVGENDFSVCRSNHGNPARLRLISVPKSIT